MTRRKDEAFEAALAAHYQHDPERDRLDTSDRLEGVRTRELLERFCPHYERSSLTSAAPGAPMPSRWLARDTGSLDRSVGAPR